MFAGAENFRVALNLGLEPMHAFCLLRHEMFVGAYGRELAVIQCNTYAMMVFIGLAYTVKGTTRLLL